MDECHIACKRKQTISNMFKNFGLLDLSFLLENDFKILEFSATPNGTLYDLDMWNNHSAKILSEPGSGYVGVLDLMQQQRLKQFKSLYYDESDKKHETTKDEVVTNITELINTMLSYPTLRISYY
jgi:hypothetical protein